MRKKTLSLALALVMCLGLMIPVFAADSDFTVENGILVKYNGSGGDVVIPSGVTQIGRAAFADCKKLTSVIIPDGVTQIGDSAFSNCRDLSAVTIPGSVNQIGERVFSSCTSLTTVTIPAGITKIDTFCFAYCHSLASVTIPVSVTSLGNGAFYACRELKDIYYAGTEAQWKAIFKSKIYGDPTEDAVIHYNSAAPAQPQQPTVESASPTNDKLTVDGVPATPTVYKIGGSNYFKIRDVAALLNGTSKQFSVGYDSARKSVTATTGEGYAKLDTDLTGAPAGGNQTATPSNDVIYVNGEKADLTVYKIDGGNYFKLRDLGDALGFIVDWNKEQGMIIRTK